MVRMENTEKTKKAKKRKDIRSAVIMVLVMVAMLSAATYAWFSLSSSPTVTGLEMTAATSGGLKISETGAANTWYDAIDISAQNTDTNSKLTPVSVLDSDANGVYEAKFYEPVYTGNTVTSLNGTALNANGDSGLGGYVAKYTYYLKSEEDDSVKVGIITAAPSTQTGTMGIDGNNQANVPGSFVRKTDSSDTNSAINAVRIGFVVDGTMYIYEPNYESVTNTGSHADNGLSTAPVSNVISGTDGIITKGNKTGENYTSIGLFEVNSAGKQITMYIWLEGTDDDCVDQIQADEIEAQIQFTVVE